jgi:hypothetical protein
MKGPSGDSVLYATLAKTGTTRNMNESLSALPRSFAINNPMLYPRGQIRRIRTTTAMAVWTKTQLEFTA